MKETPDDPELLDLAGQILIFNNKDEEACKQFRRAIEIGPTQINTYVRLAIVLRSRLDKKAEAEEVMYDMIHHKVKEKVKDKDGKVVKDKDGKDSRSRLRSMPSPWRRFRNMPIGFGNKSGSTRPWSRRNGFWNWRRKTPRGCGSPDVAAWRRAIMQDGGRLPESRHQGGQDRSRHVQSHGRRQDPSRPAQGSHGGPAKGLENTKGTPGYAEILWDVINLNIVDRKFDEAEKGIKELRDLRSGQDRYRPQLVEFLEARLAVTKGDWSVAKAALLGVLPRLQDDPGVQKLAYWHLGQCYHQEGDVEKQIIAYLEAVKIDPYMVSARMELAEIYMSRGDFPAAAEQYSKLLKAPRPDAETALSLARIMIMMRLREDKEKRDWEPVEKLLDQIERQKPPTPAAAASLTVNLAVLKAEVLLAKDLRKQAGDELHQCSLKYPASAQVWLALINLAMYEAEQETDAARKAQKWKQVSEQIDRAEQTLGDNLIVREKRGSCAVRRKDPHARELLKEAGRERRQDERDREEPFVG